MNPERPKILIDLTRTAIRGGASGIPRVCRSILNEDNLNAQAAILDVCFNQWRRPNPREVANLRSERPKANSRIAKSLRKLISNLPINHKLRLKKGIDKYDAALLPEVFEARTFRNYPSLKKFISGPIIAVCHDLIALDLHHLASSETARWFPSYIRHLANFDGIACISEATAEALQNYWLDNRIEARAAVRVIPLGETALTAAELPLKYSTSKTPNSPPMILAVGTMEGRKNHSSLFSACEQLWNDGYIFELHIAGCIHPESGIESEKKMRSLQAQNKPIIHHNGPSDETLKALYTNCHFTVISSLNEGFGLPAIESLAFQKPCACTPVGHLPKIAKNGGCHLFKSTSAGDIYLGLSQLLKDRDYYNELKTQAKLRKFRTWEQYNYEIIDFINCLQTT